MSSLSYFPFFLTGRSCGGGSKRKPKKQPMANWFEELNAGQCKELATAAKLKASGSKTDIVNRLMEHDFVGTFGGNKKGYRLYSGNIVNLDTLKAECRNRSLQVGGNKFDLVLRIAQHEQGTGGNSLKRAATTKLAVDENGVEQNDQVAKKKLKVPPKKPSPAAMYNRVQNKIQACKQKKYQTHYGSKAHAPEVCDLVQDLLYSLREYTSTDPKLVVNACYPVVSSFVDNFDQFDRPGYCKELESSVDRVVEYANLIRNSVTQEDLDKLADVMMDWQSEGSNYGLLDDCDMKEAARTIRHGPPSKPEEPPQEQQESHKKRAAAVDKEVNPSKGCASPDTAATEPSTHD
jgi:hypothetical protein